MWPQSFRILALVGLSGQFHNPTASSRETELQIKLKRRVVGSRVGVNGLENGFFATPGIESRFPSCPARRLITVPIQTCKLITG